MHTETHAHTTEKSCALHINPLEGNISIDIFMLPVHGQYVSFSFYLHVTWSFPNHPLATSNGPQTYASPRPNTSLTCL